MKPELPRAVALYLEAENSDRLDAIDECFAEDAQVRDEGQVFRGRDAIRTWKGAAKARYRYQVQPLSAQEQDGTWQVRVQVTGSFPGSPVELDYAIALQDGRIASLEIR